MNMNEHSYLLNVRSFDKKIDDVLEIFSNNMSLGVMLLTETWYDHDSNCIGRLRQLGFRVIDRPRPRSEKFALSLSTNHGGLAAFSSASVGLTLIHLKRL